MPVDGMHLGSGGMANTAVLFLESRRLLMYTTKQWPLYDTCTPTTAFGLIRKRRSGHREKKKELASQTFDISSRHLLPAQSLIDVLTSAQSGWPRNPPTVNPGRFEAVQGSDASLLVF